MKGVSIRLLVVLMMIGCLISPPASAAVKISPVQEPPPSANLRVFALVLTHEMKTFRGPRVWLVSPEEMEQASLEVIGKMLKTQGIYEVVTPAEIHAAIGDQSISVWEWTDNDYQLAKDVGKSLFADYVLVVERSFTFNLQMDLNLFNLGTGRHFSVSNYVPARYLKRLGDNDLRKKAGAEALKLSYQRLFSDARGDLLQTALAKGKVSQKKAPGETGKLATVSGRPEAHDQPAPIHRNKLREPMKPDPPPSGEKPVTAKEKGADEASPKPVDSPAPPPPARQVAVGVKAKPLAPDQERPVKPIVAKTKTLDRDKTMAQNVFEKDLEAQMTVTKKSVDSPRLVVYDFETGEHLKVVGLILTDALREELLHSANFILVNRENILKIMDEYKLQQSGAVDEKSAVKMGKWLAANEAVTGNLAILGTTCILQVKRIDIKTLSTISLGSLKCPAGREDELLDQMPNLARKLIHTP